MQIKEALNLLDEHEMPANIIDHVIKVAQISQLIAEAYIKNGYKIDEDALICAALLHDLFKITAKDKHSEEVYKFLNDLGKNKIALIAYKHDFSAIIHPDKKPITLEEKILNYSDKRVKHDEIVTINKRFDDFKQRYNPNEENPEWVKKAIDIYFELEKELFKPLDIGPEDIKEENLKDL